MKSVFLALTMLSASVAFAQAPMVQWQKDFGGTNYDYANAVRQTSDGGYIIIGSTESLDGDVTGNHGGEDYWIVKTDDTGGVQWTKTYGGSLHDIGRDILQVPGGGYIVAGSSESVDGEVTGNHGNYDCWIVRLDDTGSILWEKSYGGTGEDDAMSIKQTSDKGYIIAGLAGASSGDVTGNHGNDDYWVFKIDSVGNLQWQKSLGGSRLDQAYGVDIASDGGYFVIGYSASIDGDITDSLASWNYWLVKLDTAGTLLWQKTLGGSQGDHGYSVEHTQDGGCIVAGTSASSDGNCDSTHRGGDDYWIAKLSQTGTLQWQKSLGGSGTDNAYPIRQTADGGFVVAGASNSNDSDVTSNHGNYDFWIVKTDSVGNIKWQESIGDTALDVAYAMDLTSDGGYVLAGTTFWNATVNHGSADFLIVKLKDTTVTNTGITQAVHHSNLIVYPNPATNTLVCKSASGFRNAVVSIHDLLGREVLQLRGVSGNDLKIDINALPAGAYMIQINDGGKLLYGKFLKQ